MLPLPIWFREACVAINLIGIWYFIVGRKFLIGKLDRNQTYSKMMIFLSFALMLLGVGMMLAALVNPQTNLATVIDIVGIILTVFVFANLYYAHHQVYMYYRYTGIKEAVKMELINSGTARKYQQDMYSIFWWFKVVWPIIKEDRKKYVHLQYKDL
ncbi:MAG TPA: hypothetical protein VJJ80_00290 [Patescibacteria group bacterium]|nr:hypothetical protein [Patescibacteria group bacterium]